MGGRALLWIVLILGVALVACPPPLSRAQESYSAPAKSWSRTAYTVNQSLYRLTYGESTPGECTAFSSGKKAARALTALHCVKNQPVILADGELAQVVFSDESLDIAVLAVTLRKPLLYRGREHYIVEDVAWF